MIPSKNSGRFTSQKADKKFVILMAMLTSVMAMSIDTMLPAMNEIGKDLGVTLRSDLQYVITFLFLGFGVGQFIFGPISDSIGRKKPIYIGGAIFLVGCLISYFSNSLEWMMVGRFLQGVGAAAFRTISIAIVRDKYSGPAMAETISLVMTIFILVPVFAPSIGQLIITYLNWRNIFLFFIFLSSISLTWFWLKQEETLKIENRKKFNLKQIFAGSIETITNPVSGLAILTSGLTFGSFVAYLSSSQHIFQQIYEVGDKFPLYFGGLAFTIGLASLVNSKLVAKFGVIKLIKIALVVMSFSSLIFLAFMYFSHSPIPKLYQLMIFFSTFFACVGLLFGNLNALALSPLGHIAGLASSVVGSLQNFISVAIGVVISHFFDKDMYPIVIGFASMSTSCLLIVFLGLRENK